MDSADGLGGSSVTRAQPRRSIRLYVTSVVNGHEHTDQRRFFTTDEALEWLRTEPRLYVVSASIYNGEKLLAEVHDGEF